MGYREILVEIRSKKDLIKIEKKIKRISNEYEGLSLFALIQPKKDLKMEANIFGSNVSNALKKEQQYAWIGGDRNLVVSFYNSKAVEVNAGIDKFIELNDRGNLKQGFHENEFLKQYSVKKGRIVHKKVEELEENKDSVSDDYDYDIDDYEGSSGIATDHMNAQDEWRYNNLSSEEKTAYDEKQGQYWEERNRREVEEAKAYAKNYGFSEEAALAAFKNLKENAEESPAKAPTAAQHSDKCSGQGR